MLQPIGVRVHHDQGRIHSLGSRSEGRHPAWLHVLHLLQLPTEGVLQQLTDDWREPCSPPHLAFSARVLMVLMFVGCAHQSWSVEIRNWGVGTPKQGEE